MTNEILYTAFANKKLIKKLRISAVIPIALALAFCFNYESLAASAKEQISNVDIAAFLPNLLIIAPLGLGVFSILYANAISKHCIYLYKDKISGYGFVNKARLVSFDLKKEQISNIYVEDRILCINANGVVFRIETENPDTFLLCYRKYIDK